MRSVGIWKDVEGATIAGKVCGRRFCVQHEEVYVELEAETVVFNRPGRGEKKAYPGQIVRVALRAMTGRIRGCLGDRIKMKNLGKRSLPGGRLLWEYSIYVHTAEAPAS